MRKILNRLKYKIIEIMTIGKEMEELRKSAYSMAKGEADEEFQRRFTTQHKESKYIQTNTSSYNFWLKKNKDKYNEMVKELYHKNLSELKKMWYFKNLDKLIPSDKKD